jgi:hypothetical protein
VPACVLKSSKHQVAVPARLNDGQQALAHTDITSSLTTAFNEARFVSCDLWNDKHALVSKVIAMFLQKAWGIRNAYKHGTTVDVFESASERRGADGIDARA